MSASTTYLTTSSGLRIVHRQTNGRVEYCGVTTNVGSRDEHEGQYGIAHFIEHTIFKGTSRHKARFIINRMEEIGGELNAYTTKEETVIYAAAPSGGFRRAAELIGELVTGSVFPTAEIDREREVIADEIDSYDDTPSEAVFDSFDELFFKDSQLAHNILGTHESIKEFRSDTCRNFIKDYYTAPNMVFFYLGKENPQKVLKIVERSFINLPVSGTTLNRTIPKAVEPFTTVYSIDSHQSHTVIGARIPGLHSPERYAITLLSNILGGPGMNSLFNIALREKRGLVYTVDAQTNLYTDCGAFTVYFGCDRDDVEKCRKLIRNEIDRFVQAPISDSKLSKAKRQYIGQCVIATENRENEALSLGRAVLRYNEVKSFESVKERIMDVTPADLQKMAEYLAPSLISTLTLQ